MFEKSGSEKKTSNGLLAVGAVPTRVFSLSSESAIARVIKLRNSSASGNVYVTLNVAANNGNSISFSKGRLFPSGCYVDLDNNASGATIEYTKEQ